MQDRKICGAGQRYTNQGRDRRTCCDRERRSAEANAMPDLEASRGFGAREGSGKETACILDAAYCSDSTHGMPWIQEAPASLHVERYGTVPEVPASCVAPLWHSEIPPRSREVSMTIR